MILLGSLRLPTQSSSGRSWFQLTPHLVPKMENSNRFLHPADTWLTVYAPRQRSPMCSITIPKSSVSISTSV